MGRSAHCPRQKGLPMNCPTHAIGETTVRLRASRFVSGLTVAWALVVLLLPSQLQALDPQRPLSQALLRIWQFQQGLPRAALFSIRQTEDGYIWLGTQAGLHRFDGVRFTAINVSSGKPMANLWIQDLQEDREHNLWIATDNAGLIRLRDGVATTFGQSTGLPSDHVRCLLVDASGKLWVGTDAGLARLAGNRFTVFLGVEGPVSGDVRALCQAQDGSIWIGGEGNQLSVWNGTNFTSQVLASLSPRESVQALLSQDDGSLWIGTSTGLVQKNGINERHFTRADGLADDWVHCLAASRNGTIWIGTKNGLSRRHNDVMETFRTRDGLSQSTVYTLCEDREGSLWAGTKHGLNQFIDRRTIPFTVAEGLPSNDAGPVVQDSSGNIWVGTLGAGLARFDGRHFSVAANTRLGLPSNTILSLAEGTDRDLWIGTDAGLCRMRDRRVLETFTTDQGLPSNVVRAVCRDRSGTLWVGTAAGIAEFRDGKFVIPSGDMEILRLPVQALIDYRGQTLLMAGEGTGLYQVVGGRMSRLSNSPRVPRGVDAFYQDQDGLLWTAVPGSGLGLLDGEKWFSFTVKDGLYDDDVFGIVADDEGRLWMACSRGIFSVDRNELRQFTAGTITRVSSTPFSPTDALRTIECQHGIQPALWKMRDGQIWFSTIRGIIVIDPARFQRKLPPPPVRVEEVRVNGKDTPPGDVGTLPPGQTNIDFHYTALSLVSPTRIAFRYMLEGFDKDWIEAGGRRQAFYTNLPPGSYRFRVSAANPDGAWNEATQPVAFTLQPYFYQTRWFVPSLLLLSAIVAWGAVRLRVRQVRLQLHAVLAERSRIARELHDTLIQGFSGVTMQMQALIARLRNSPERQTLSEIVQDAANCLREARHSVAGLRNTRGDELGLAAAVAQTARQLTAASDMTLQLRLDNCPASLTPDVQYNILRIVQEAVANAVKHSAARQVEVALGCSPHQLTLSVRDNGVGFDTQLHEPGQSGHYGLIGMRERATHLGADLRIVSEPGHGTLVSLTLPLIVTATAAPIEETRSTEPALESSP